MLWLFLILDPPIMFPLQVLQKVVEVEVEASDRTNMMELMIIMMRHPERRSTQQQYLQNIQQSKAMF